MLLRGAHWLLLALAAGTVFVAPSRLSAQPADTAPSDDDLVVARETFRAGEAAYARGDFQAAANSFEVSHRLAPHPFTMLNAGLAWEAAERPAKAADAFHSAIDSGELDAAQTADAQQRLDTIRKSHGWVLIEGPTDARVAVGHVDGARPPLLVHLAPGEHRVLVTHGDGATKATAVVVTAAAATSLRLEAPAAPVPTPTAAPPPPPPDEGTSSGMFVGGWITLGLGAAAAGAAVGLGVAALSARDDFEASGNTDADARSSAATLRTVTNVMWGVAGVAAIAGTSLVILGWDDGDTEAALTLAPGQLGLRARF
jgi:hypothetical protein